MARHRVQVPQPLRRPVWSEGERKQEQRAAAEIESVTDRRRLEARPTFGLTTARNPMTGSRSVAVTRGVHCPRPTAKRRADHNSIGSVPATWRGWTMTAVLWMRGERAIKPAADEREWRGGRVRETDRRVVRDDARPPRDRKAAGVRILAGQPVACVKVELRESAAAVREKEPGQTPASSPIAVASAMIRVVSRRIVIVSTPLGRSSRCRLIEAVGGSRAARRIDMELEHESTTRGGSSMPSWSEQWRDALGPLWRWQFALIAVLLFAAGFSLPFADPDLRFIWRRENGSRSITPCRSSNRSRGLARGSVPGVFVGDRAALFRADGAFGPIGLGLLQGFIYVALAAVMVVLGKAAVESVGDAVMVAGNLIVTLGTTPYVRPQSVLLIVAPLVWALVYRSLDTRRLAPTLVGLAARARSSQTRTCFSDCRGAVRLLLTDRRRIESESLLVPVAMAFGWFISPYALALAEYSRSTSPERLVRAPERDQRDKPGYLMCDQGRGGVAPRCASSSLSCRGRWRHGSTSRAAYSMAFSGSRGCCCSRLPSDRWWCGGCLRFQCPGSHSPWLRTPTVPSCEPRSARSFS